MGNKLILDTIKEYRVKAKRWWRMQHKNLVKSLHISSSISRKCLWGISKITLSEYKRPHARACMNRQIIRTIWSVKHAWTLKMCQKSLMQYRQMGKDDPKESCNEFSKFSKYSLILYWNNKLLSLLSSA